MDLRWEGERREGENTGSSDTKDRNLTEASQRMHTQLNKNN